MTRFFRSMLYELTDRFEVPADADRTWAFFSKAENLATITPPWMSFTVKTPSPVPIGLDARIDYTIRVMGLPMRWRSLIVDWRPPTQFIDLQLKGPYALWHHAHTFEPSPSGGTTCGDRVLYKLPVPGVSNIVHAMMVRRQLLSIFRYRRNAIEPFLGKVKPVQADVEIRGVR